MRENKVMQEILHFIILTCACLAAGVFYIVNSPRRFSLCIVFLMLIAGVVSLVLFQKGRKTQAGILFILLISFLIRADYVIYTPTWVRQHDVIGFGAGFGQAAFIEYFYEKVRLLDVDPRAYWGFFQPPLHHFLAAMWLRLNVFFGYSYPHACENVQILILFYACVMNWFALKIYQKLKLTGLPLVAALSLTALHPCFILMSGSINNDMLCILLQVMSLYYFLCWNEEEKWRDILLLALCLGGSMMAKLSGILIAPAIGCLFLYHMFCHKERFWYYVRQYLCFALISIPLGIWSPVRNLIKFNLPLNYTPKVGEPIGNFSLLQRIFDIRTGTPFTCMIANKDAYDEFNVFLAMLKTSLVGEYAFGQDLKAAVPIGWVLLLSGAVLMVFLFIITIRELFDKNSVLPVTVRLFLGIYYVVSLLFFFQLCFSIQNFSSQDFRYIVYLLVVEAIFYGAYLMKEKKNRTVRYLSLAVLTVFLTASVGLYLLIGTIQWN